MTKKKKIDVLLHKYVPKHVLLTKDETSALLTNFKIGLNDLPQMFEKDPVSIAIGVDNKGKQLINDKEIPMIKII